MIGQTISHYRVTAKIGAGGMGEVYRATDSRLGRDVALKVLPPAFAQDAERMARFQREAQVLASLNHPNIASIYGLEEAGGVRALVMELVEGPTLAQRIAQGAVPIEDALHIAKQIAEALEAAHEKGIIHRDLKPANVKITPDGKVKVLDFGLAKALEGNVSHMDASNSPTISMAATRMGVILGTAAYMSPEQAKGKSADRRADIWAFGAVLHEMLTGKQLYSGETPSEILAAVIMKEPEWNMLPANTPPRVRQLLRRCLTKEPKTRLRDIGEARIAIEEVLSGTGSEIGAEARAVSEATATGPQTARARRAAPWVVAGVLVIALGVASWGWWRATRPVDQGVTQFAIFAAPGEALPLGGTPALALSPDGTRLAYVVEREGKTQIYVRSMDRMEASLLPGTEGGRDPFFSPDGQWLAFFADLKVKKMLLSGGPAIPLSNVAGDTRGASWGPDGFIYISPAPTSSVLRVSADGGTQQPVSRLDVAKNERTHRWPQVLPDGKAVLFTVGMQDSPEFYDDSRIEAVVLATGERRVLLEGASMARYAAPGHLIYSRGGVLYAAPFDLARLKITGTGIPIVQNVSGDVTAGSVHFTVSGSGSLAYIPGTSARGEKSLVWMDRKGNMQPLGAPTGDYWDPSVSPDGQRVAMSVTQGKSTDIWIYDIARGTMNRLTFEAQNQMPVWSADGKRLAYSSTRGSRNLQPYWQPSDGSAPAQLLANEDVQVYTRSWSPDGKLFLYDRLSTGDNADIWYVSMEGERKAQAFLASKAYESQGEFSPDGRWLAYGSTESGQFEVYVQPFPATGVHWQISSGGGQEPRWSRNGREIYYYNGDKMMEVPIETRGSFQAGKPEVVFSGFRRTPGARANYSVHPDGKRFLMVKPSEAKLDPRQMNMVLHWTEALHNGGPGMRK